MDNILFFKVPAKENRLSKIGIVFRVYNKKVTKAISWPGFWKDPSTGWLCQHWGPDMHIPPWGYWRVASIFCLFFTA